ncbi:hypothetical protein FGO68_gene16316 [Halteria grandinella]|uniref:Protein kinase domain-containing protein n=1 Tax=Halteria grandinella TaxID=5974 RepID=A0A8J8TAV8_HALGN|nr:hypothetical protein FGO68_gene16316 [Halteria grandinella]
MKSFEQGKELVRILQQASNIWKSAGQLSFKERYTLVGNKTKALLGEGSYGQVYKCIDRHTKQTVAIKQVKKQGKRDDQILRMRLEIELMTILSEENHPGVVKIIEYTEDSQYFNIAMEYVEGGSLQDWVLENKQNQYKEDVYRPIIVQLVEGLSFMHKLGIVHRDIKLDNILLNKDPITKKIEPKFVDFGLSFLLFPGQTSEEPVGSLAFLSPEIVKYLPHTAQTDVWSLGIVVYIIMTGRFPFVSTEAVQITMQNIAHKEINFNQSFWIEKSSQAKDLIAQMLKKDAKERITTQKLLEHPWIQQQGQMRANAAGVSAPGINCYNKE